MIRELFEQLLGVNEAEEDKIAFAKEKPNIIQQDKVETEQPEEQAEEEAGEISPDEEDEDVEPEGSKEYLGNNGTDQYFYFVKTPNEQGKAKDLQVIDSSGKILFSAEENGLAVDNAKDFLMQALKEVDMANIAFEALMKYMIPAEEKSEEEIEDEKAQKENEQENINNPQQSSKDRQDGISAPPMPVGVGSRVGENIQKLKEKFGLNEMDTSKIGSGELPNKYYVTVSSDYMVEAEPGSYDWASDHNLIKAQGFPEMDKVFDTYIEAKGYAQELIEQIDSDLIGVEGYNFVSIEDHLSGEVFSGGIYASKNKNPYIYRIDSHEDANFTKSEMEKQGEVFESKLKKDLKGVKDGKPIIFKSGQVFTYRIVKNTDDGSEQVVFKFDGGGNAQIPASSKEEYVIEGKVPADPATDPEGYMGELKEKFGVSESSFGSVEWQKDQVMKILGKLKHGIELDEDDKAFVSTQAGFLNIPDNAYLEKLKKIAAKAAASERKIKEMMNIEKDKISMLEMKHELVEAKSLEELRDTIDGEADFVDIKPYSHNIISLTLQMIAKEYGNEEANKAIGDFDLESLGWKKIQEGVYERTVNEQIPELPEEPSVDQPVIGDPNASQPEDAVVPAVEVAPSTAEEAQAQIKMDYPEEPFASTALAYADLIFDDPKIFGAIRNLNWDGIYANGDTFIKQVKIVDHYNKFTKEVAQRIVDKFGDDAKYKLARDGSVATYITVLSPTENLSLTGIKDLTNADKAELTNEPGEIRLWWD